MTSGAARVTPAKPARAFALLANEYSAPRRIDDELLKSSINVRLPVAGFEKLIGSSLNDL